MENGINDCPLFDPDVLLNIDWSTRKATFKNDVTPSNPGGSLVLRPLCLSDYEKGILKILSQLTTVGDVNKEQFEKRFNEMKRCDGTYYIAVLEDTESNMIIGCASLVVEQKFIHSTSSRGRIEDVVVSELYRGKQLGKLLVEALTLLGKSLGCYKMSLECKDQNVEFYKSFGYEPDGNNFLVQRFKD